MQQPGEPAQVSRLALTSHPAVSSLTNESPRAGSLSNDTQRFHLDLEERQREESEEEWDADEEEEWDADEEEQTRIRNEGERLAELEEAKLHERLSARAQASGSYESCWSCSFSVLPSGGSTTTSPARPIRRWLTSAAK